MSVVEKDLQVALKKYFGFNTFKGLQEAVITSLLQGNNTFVIMPTGGGKSLCYQLPALMQEGTAIIVSPLIALMKNQVDAIRGVSEHDGIAHVLNSSLNKTEIKKVKQDIVDGITKLLYVAPESLTKEENVEFLRSVKISFMAVDEAHCISEWGHDFRPEYRNLRQIIKRIGDNIPIIGLTATATPKVQEDILKTFNIDAYKTLEAYELSTVFIENLGRGKFKMRALPLESQIAPINGILAEDLDHDAYLDLLMVGNNYATEVGAGRYDASVGVMLKNKGDGTFEVINNNDSDFLVIGDSKSIVKVNTTKKSLVLVGKNNGSVISKAMKRKGETFVNPTLNEVFAEISCKDGSKRKHEFLLGGGYLSQSSNTSEVINSIEFITFFDASQEVTRKLNFN
mgnify:CR=1 FL=1